jgi:hypothetical protein
MHQNAEAIHNCLIAFRLNKEPVPSKYNLTTLFGSMMHAGFPDLAEKYRKMLLDLENDSTYYFQYRVVEKFYYGKPLEALELYRQKLEDSTSVYRLSQAASAHMLDRNFNEMDRYAHLFLEEANRKKITLSGGAAGYWLLRAGKKEEADAVFEWTIQSVNELVDAKRVSIINGNSDIILASIYSVRKQPGKALEQLRNLLKFEAIPIWLVTSIRMNPMFDNLRELPEFQALQKEFEFRYEREREKARKVLRKEGFDV